MDDHDCLVAAGLFGGDKWVTTDDTWFGKLLYDAGVGPRTKTSCLGVQCELVTSGIVRKSKDSAWSANQRLTNKSVSRLRIRVENIIGILKNRTIILKTTLPSTELGMMHKIFYVCCMLHNFGKQKIY